MCWIIHPFTSMPWAKWEYEPYIPCFSVLFIICVFCSCHCMCLKDLKLKDEECERLSKVRDQLGQELEELTASLFEVCLPNDGADLCVSCEHLIVWSYSEHSALWLLNSNDSRQTQNTYWRHICVSDPVHTIYTIYIAPFVKWVYFTYLMYEVKR